MFSVFLIDESGFGERRVASFWSRADAESFVTRQMATGNYRGFYIADPD